MRYPYPVRTNRVGRKITHHADNRVLSPLNLHFLPDNIFPLEKHPCHILPQHDICVFIQAFLFRERTPFYKMELVNFPITSIYKSKRKCLTRIIHGHLPDTIIIHEIILFRPYPFHQPSCHLRVYTSNIPSIHILKSAEHNCPITIYKRSFITGCIIHELEHDNNKHECKRSTNHAEQSIHFIMPYTT